MRIILPLLALLVLSPAYGEVYRWVDDNGTVHFSDEPRGDGGESERVHIREVNSAESVEIDAGGGSAAQTGSGDRVVLYSTSWCPHCKRARAYLEDNGIPYTEYDVEDSAKGRRDYARMGGGGVPIILVGDRRMTGFSAAGFERLYER